MTQFGQKKNTDICRYYFYFQNKHDKFLKGIKLLFTNIIIVFN